jgi:hypothetical protein
MVFNPQFNSMGPNAQQSLLDYLVTLASLERSTTVAIGFANND